MVEGRYVALGEFLAIEDEDGNWAIMFVSPQFVNPVTGRIHTVITGVGTAPSKEAAVAYMADAQIRILLDL